jgi:tRNA threonylcarbamoyladenosine biosynthesis protein TsaE
MPSRRPVHQRQARTHRNPSSRRTGSRPPGSESSASPAWRYRSRSAAETDRLGRVLGECLREGDIIALFGELGTGKTVLVRGIAAGLGASPRSVSSPTFVLIHEYRGRLRLVHADLYRIESALELPQLGLSDYLDGRHVVALEWAEKAGRELPDDRLEIMLSHHSETARAMILKPTGPGSRGLLARTRKRWATRRRLVIDREKPNRRSRSSGLNV